MLLASGIVSKIRREGQEIPNLKILLVLHNLSRNLHTYGPFALRERSIITQTRGTVGGARRKGTPHAPAVALLVH